MSSVHPDPSGSFRAHCRLIHRDADAGQVRQCDIKFDNRAEFELHMTKMHRRAKPRSKSPIKSPAKSPGKSPGKSPAMPASPKRPKRRMPPRTRQRYQPKEHDVGAWVTFAESREEGVVVRHGQVWSLGPAGEGRSRWVVPDDGGDSVVVRINKSPVLTTRTVLDVVPGYEMHRENLRRAENLRRFGRLFPVVVDTRWEYTWWAGRTLAEYWRWHVDPACPHALGNPAPSKQFNPLSVTRVAMELISGRINSSTTRFCRRCFWLDEIDDTAAWRNDQLGP